MEKLLQPINLVRNFTITSFFKYHIVTINRSQCQCQWQYYEMVYKQSFMVVKCLLTFALYPLIMKGMKVKNGRCGFAG